jgi:hypothetical protein
MSAHATSTIATCGRGVVGELPHSAGVAVAEFAEYVGAVQ